MVEILIASLAAYRIARMISSERGAFDCFTKFREFVESLFPEGHWMRYGVTCPLCIGFWLALVLYVVPLWVSAPIAVAGLQVVLQKLDWTLKYINEERQLNIEALKNETRWMKDSELWRD